MRARRHDYKKDFWLYAKSHSVLEAVIRFSLISREIELPEDFRMYLVSMQKALIAVNS